jgi:hypothetical protein
VADLHQLLVDELDAAKTRRLEELDLRLDEQVEGNFGYKEAWPRTSRVANGGADVLNCEVVSRIYTLQRMSEDIVEDVVNPSSTTQFLGRDLEGSAVDGGHKVTDELGHELEDEGAAVLLAEEGRIAESVELLLSLAHEGVETSLHVGKLVADVVHEDLSEE